MAELRYRGRSITTEDILYIQDLIAVHPQETRRALSKKLCEAWQWRQPNGELRDMVCRGMLLMLDRAGQIALPPVKFVPHNPLARRARPSPVVIDTTPIEGRLHQIQPLEFVQVRRSRDEPLFKSLVEEHHYLGYEQPVGEHLKYLVRAQGRPVACLAWSSAARHLGSRDRWIGWSQEARRRNIRFIAYNTRFLIFPWVRIEHRHRTFSAGWRRRFPMIGSGCTGIRSSSWKPLWTRSDSVEPVTARPTGRCSAGPQDEESNPIATCRIDRSKRFLGFR